MCVQDADVSGIRLLLGQAVDSSHPLDDVCAVDPDDASTGEQVAQYAECTLVGILVKVGHKNHLVSNVEVCITDRQRAFG